MPTLILAMAYMSMVKFPQVKSTPYPFLSNSPNSRIDISKFHPGLLKKWLGLIRSPLKMATEPWMQDCDRLSLEVHRGQAPHDQVFFITIHFYA